MNMYQVDGNISINSSLTDSSSICSNVSSVETFAEFRDSESILSSEESFLEEYLENEVYPIPVIVNNTHNPQINPPAWYDENTPQEHEKRTPVRKVIKRDNRLQKSSFLPVIAVANLRSLVPKIRNFAKDVHERGIGVGLLTEVWQKMDKKKHILKLKN